MPFFPPAWIPIWSGSTVTTPSHHSGVYTSQAISSPKPHSIFTTLLCTWNIVATLSYYGGALALSNIPIWLSCYLLSKIYAFFARERDAETVKCIWVNTYIWAALIYNITIALMVLNGQLDPAPWDVKGVMLIVHGTAVVIMLLGLGLVASLVVLGISRFWSAVERANETCRALREQDGEKEPLLPQVVESDKTPC